jgi:phosphohistidine phosphatase
VAFFIIMQVYLIRHAHALDGDDDGARPLSGRGKMQIRRLAAFLRRSGVLEAREFWHSPLVRARDTARMLVKELRVRAKLKPVTGLIYDDDPAIMARRLAKRRQPVALVGHEPHLSALASRLLAGRGRAPVVVMKKCTILALERTEERWAVRWLVSPELFPWRS